MDKKIVKKTEKIVKKKREPIKVIIEGQEMTLKQIATTYNLAIKTVRVRYKVGNRGKLLIRPSNRSKS